MIGIGVGDLDGNRVEVGTSIDPDSGVHVVYIGNYQFPLLEALNVAEAATRAVRESALCTSTDCVKF